ncbi:AAA family ATPase [Candidatus Woesearchaeota archaeon]|nr:AAA family ATPase [Candidatus Woesearchaeota archaeon]
MKVILVGDPCSGKSTVIKRLEKEGYAVAIEDGIKKIPLAVENDKIQAILWFTEYYFNRDKQSSTNKDKKIIAERSVHFQYAHTSAQAKYGKIRNEEKEHILKRIDEFAKQLPLEKETIVIQTVCSNEQTQTRLQERSLHKKQDRYWNILRQETEDFFKEKTKYYKVDTTILSTEEVYGEVKRILKENNF